jgi:hypothetical protein
MSSEARQRKDMVVFEGYVSLKTGNAETVLRGCVNYVGFFSTATKATKKRLTTYDTTLYENRVGLLTIVSSGVQD